MHTSCGFNNSTSHNQYTAAHQGHGSAVSCRYRYRSQTTVCMYLRHGLTSFWCQTRRTAFANRDLSDAKKSPWKIPYHENGENKKGERKIIAENRVATACSNRGMSSSQLLAISAGDHGPATCEDLVGLCIAMYSPHVCACVRIYTYVHTHNTGIRMFLRLCFFSCIRT